MIKRLLLLGLAASLLSQSAQSAEAEPESRALISAVGCPAADSAHDRWLFQTLDGNNIIPLCRTPLRSNSRDFTFRRTMLVFSSSMVETYAARGGRLNVSSVDHAWYPPNNFRFNSSIRADWLHSLLQEANIDQLWTTLDPNCDPQVVVISEIGSIIEFQDASGYRIRSGPRAQANTEPGNCVTPYRKAFSEILELLNGVNS